MRTMLAYSRYSPTRSTLESDLPEFIGYDLYALRVGHVNIDDEERCAALEVDRRVDDAVRIVRGWRCDPAWREGEEWMGDALVAVVTGWGEIECLPWAPDQMLNR